MDKVLYSEINNIIINHWKFLNNQWPFKINKYRHRTEIKNINNIEAVKAEIYSKLGYIPVFFFLTVIFGNYDYKGLYRNIEKGLLLLYQLISGNSIREMYEFIPYTSFYDIYREFWFDKYKELNDLFDKLLEHMFSNKIIRILSAGIKNPQYFKQITLLLDRHDSQIHYNVKNNNNKILNKSDLYSYKFNKAGFRIQLICDINEMILFVLKSIL